MKKDKIIQLLQSPNYEDILIALSFMQHMSYKEILVYLDLPEGDNTFYRGDDHNAGYDVIGVELSENIHVHIRNCLIFFNNGKPTFPREYIKL